MLGRDFKSPVAKTWEWAGPYRMLRIFFTADYPCILTFHFPPHKLLVY